MGVVVADESGRLSIVQSLGGGGVCFPNSRVYLILVNNAFLSGLTMERALLSVR